MHTAYTGIHYRQSINRDTAPLIVSEVANFLFFLFEETFLFNIMTVMINDCMCV